MPGDHFLDRLASGSVVGVPMGALLFFAAGCDPSLALAPQTASIEIAINGIPADGIASALAFIEDTHPPYNRVENTVPVGGSVVFDNLGVGFDITFGIRNLGQHRCTVHDSRQSGLALTLNDSTGVVETRLDQIEKTSRNLRMRNHQRAFV